MVDDGSTALNMLVEQAQRAAGRDVRISAAYDFRQVSHALHCHTLQIDCGPYM